MESIEPPVETNAAPHRPRTRIWIVATILGIAILGTGLSIWFGKRTRECNPVLPDLKNLPMQFGLWSGTQQNLDPIVVKATQADTLVVRNFRNQNGESVTTFLAYYSDVNAGLYQHPLTT